MENDAKLASYGILWLSIVSALFRGTSAQCALLPNCDVCYNSTYCQECEWADYGYYGLRADGAGCEDCLEISGGTCAYCTSVTMCDQCSNNDQGPVSPTTSAQCAACATNCQFCAYYGAGRCDDYSCNSGYANDVAHTCSPCVPGCQECAMSGPGGCDVCPVGQGLYNGIGSPPADCIPCSIPNCGYCYSDNTGCEMCDPGFSMNSSGQCSACSIPNCGYCYSDNTGCEMCAPGFFMNSSGECSAWPTDCWNSRDGLGAWRFIVHTIVSWTSSRNNQPSYSR